MRTINLIVIHCSATKEGKDFKAKDIDKWHKERGFKKIGYHYVIDLDGTIERGRQDSEIGAHCTGHNKNSIGICYIGGLDKDGKPKDTRTKEQKEALWDLLRILLTKYPKAQIHGHNTFSNKDCPCFNVEETYNIINLREDKK
jgi:N-acetylmuramoyl-L-alanine amidase